MSSSSKDKKKKLRLRDLLDRCNKKGEIVIHLDGQENAENNNEEEQDSGVVIEDDKKKKKKKKRKHSQEDEVVDDVIVDNAVQEADDGEVKEKKKKKKRKHNKEDVIAEEENEDAADVVIAVNAEHEEEATGKKKKKKNKKNDIDIGKVEDVNSILVTENDEANQSSSKKEKKRKDSDKNALISSPQITFSTYKPHQDIITMTDEAAGEIRLKLGIQVYPPEASDAYKPLSSFQHIQTTLKHHCPEVLGYISSKAFSSPSPIQSQCWPPLLDGRDIVGIAATGSGKTLAFLVPALLKLSLGGMRKLVKASPRVLVVAPTRELALQSYQVFVDVGGAPSVCIYGGVSKSDQIRELRRGVEVVVATPGRLIDLLQEGNITLSEVIYLVLDEADRMLDEGFEPAIKQIVQSCPDKSNRQTVMFSATWPEEIRSLADRYLSVNVVRVVVGSEELSANHRVKQIVECVEPYQKDKKLLNLLEDYHKSRRNRVLIFVLYKKEAATLQSMVAGKGYKVTAIHGDKGQEDRSAALDEFKSGRTPLLIATDVAARGLDIPQVEYVINYSFPLTVEDYVHRIGRTGRGGASGVSHSFFTDADKSLAGALVGVLQEAGQDVPQDIYKYPMITKKKTSKLYGDFGPKQELAGKKATKITFEE